MKSFSDILASTPDFSAAGDIAVRSAPAIASVGERRATWVERAGLLGLVVVLALVMLVLFGVTSGRSQSLLSEGGPLPSWLAQEAGPTLDYDLRFNDFDGGRMANASIPFAQGVVWAAQPFIFTGAAEDRERATTCLASAAWYEAGDDEPGEQAVAQVVLNRLRHPAFPKSVCGVVFQRTSGNCQFTFTCDGSLRRIPSVAAWQRARAVAERALLGYVYATVGTATFYHADYVLPYWSKTFDKIARVKSHLFYRMRGAAGQVSAFIYQYQGFERIDPRLLSLNQAIRGVAGPLPGEPGLLTAAATAMTTVAAPLAAPQAGAPSADLRGSVLRLMDNASGQYVLQLNPAAFPGSYALAALSLCRDKPECTVMGWLQPNLIPASMPSATGAQPTLSFIYRKDSARGVEQLAWNCRQVVRNDPKQCMPGTAVDQPANRPA